ncbi:rho GTPase-activating protein 5-like [Rutidosis leptorrhynchoides]|uniref:rho GTPase-activating protein 5-like n=1 Tax=Rutidosis leptorrhynchoides TaxID=125765 RepID=UPI003A99A6FF
MTKLFRSKSCGGPPPPTATFFQPSFPNQYDGAVEEHVDSFYNNYTYFQDNPITTPFISPNRHNNDQPQNSNFTVLALLLTALRKSLVTCVVDDSDDVSSVTSSLDIGCPTDVQHVSHVTFDRFDGFLGLPVELQPDVPRKPPSASIRVFGVSVESMQCSYDDRGNSVPTLLLMMQKRLYEGGGLQAEGIFRINAENSQEEDVRKQLNKGFVPNGLDVHCLAGLIKAWFRELPTGVLDSLTPEQVMHCNTENECSHLVTSLPQTEAALLDWTINLMADVVEYEPQNKMNARNIAMVFAPNMTQMADPLTALIHAVQVMNFLKTLVIKTLREREELFQVSPSCEDKTKLERPNLLNRIESDNEEKFWSFPRKSGSIIECEFVSAKTSPLNHHSKHGTEEVAAEGIFEKLKLRKGVKKLCRHPVFQLSKSGKKYRSAIVDT